MFGLTVVGVWTSLAWMDALCKLCLRDWLASFTPHELWMRSLTCALGCISWSDV